MSTAGWLAIQTLTAALEAFLLARLVIPALPRLGHPRLIATVWTPVVLVLPLWAIAATVRGSVAGAGWAPVGAAAVIGAAGVGLRLLSRTSLERASALPTAALAATGALLLLLGLADDLSEGNALLFFGLALVLLWLGIPSLKDVRANHDQADHAAEQSAGLGLLFALALALAQTGMVLAAGRAGWRPAAGIALIPAAAAVVVAARVGPGWVTQIATWTAVVGVLGGIASFAVLRRIAQAGQLFDGRGLPPGPDRVAHGFGGFAFEGLLLLFLAVAMALADDLATGVRRALGAALVVLAVVDVVIRLTG